MKAKRFIPILCTFCLLFNLFFPLFRTNVHAENKVTLNFVGGTIEDKNKICYKDSTSGGNDDLAKIQLMTPDGNSGFEVCENLANGMQIDLEEKQYYLSVLSFTVAEGEILSLQIGNQSRRVSVVGERFYIDPQEFSGNLDIECKKDTGPPKPSYPDDVAMEVTSSDGTKMNIFLNTVRIGEEAASIIATGKGYASGNINNLIKIQLEFGSGNIGIITVNGVEINIPEGTTDEFEFSVAPVATYKIVVKKSKDTSNTPRTIVWASDKNDNFSLGEDELLKNGTVEILSIKDPDGNPVDMGDVTQDTEKNTGRAVIIPGSKVTFRLKPDYGYQLTSIRLNDEKLIAGEEQSTFEYTMPDTNIHFSGIFEKVEDKVKIESNKVKDGTIEIGRPRNRFRFCSAFCK